MKFGWIALIFLLSMIFPKFLWATPASEIKLKYDISSQSLHIEMKHVTNNPQKHRIRKITVQKNSESPLEFNYVTQSSNQTLVDDVTIAAKSGDRITVKAICSKAGTSQETLIVAPMASK